MRLFGLIGFPLSHSFSEKYFTEKFRREGITDASFLLFPIETINDFPSLLQANPELRGLSVTIPYKEKIIPFLDELDETAKAVGAVNCIRIERRTEGGDRRWESVETKENGERKEENGVRRDGGERLFLTGFNTDVHGFRQSLKPFLASQHERALILGTGGASKAVEFVLRTIGVECIFVSREKKTLPGKTVLAYSDLNEYVMNACKLIVNCSPAGTFPNVNEAPAIPYEFISSQHFLYDLVYNPPETEFLKRGKAKGALTLNGYDMLKMQAEKAWEIWK